MNRRTLADSIDGLDAQITELQREKSEFYAAYREGLEKTGMGKEEIKVELPAVKAAIRQRQRLAKDRDAVEERDDRVSSILVEITHAAKNNAPAATAAPTKAIPDKSEPTRASREDDDLAIPDYLRRAKVPA